jgi:outer membrane lipoprotein-sorting protein
MRIAAIFALVLATMGVTSPDAHAIIERMAQRNPTLQTYSARVHVNVHMLSFPYFSPQLDGTTYYRRPETYEVVFDSMPSYARGFSRLFNDVGSPLAWERVQNVTFAGTTTIGGRPTLVLRMTKKIHSDVLDHTLAYVDEASAVLVRMEWYYTNGGRISMTQGYRYENGFWVLAEQRARIDIPYVRAEAEASYGTYRTNVPLPVRGSRT